MRSKNVKIQRKIIKNRFLDFFIQLFWTCLGSVCALFSALKVSLLVVFLAILYVLCYPYLILFATHNCSSPLRSRETLINVDKASPGFLVKVFLHFFVFLINFETHPFALSSLHLPKIREQCHQCPRYFLSNPKTHPRCVP